MNKVNPTFDHLRKCYVEAENNRAKAELGLRLVTKMKEKTALSQAYEGAFEALHAKFSWNAYYQFSQVNKAMRLLDRAVEREAGNPEIHYLRFSVNYFLPRFLQKKTSLKEDRNVLLARFPFSELDETAQKQITKFMQERVKWTEEESRILGF